MTIAVLIPCYNEATTIRKVVADFHRELPSASIYVYDNNSSDRTKEAATRAGAIVRQEKRQGKGYVVRRMFREIEADYYLMVDGDDTYPAEIAKQLLAPLIEGRADMVVGNRLANGVYAELNQRRFHNFGNVLVRKLINILFSSSVVDVMSGYRGFTREFVKNLPFTSRGFEIETEITVQALDKGFIISEIPTAYRSRPEGSHSKLSTFRDGTKVLATIIWLFKDYRPLFFFAVLSGLLLASGLLIGAPPVFEYIEYSYVYRVPSAILAAGLILLSAISFSCGLILDTISRHFREVRELVVVQQRSPLSPTSTPLSVPATGHDARIYHLSAEES